MNFIPIKNSNIEGDYQIKTIFSIQISKRKTVLFFILSFLSLGFITLFAKWSEKFRYFFLYRKCNLNKASALAITTIENTFNIVPLKTEQYNLKKIHCFFFKVLKYQYNEEMGYFETLDFSEINTSFSNILSIYSNGIDEETYQYHQAKYGENLKLVPIPTLFEFLYEEMTTPFFILQYLSALIWVLENSYVYSIVLLTISFLLTIVSYVFVRSSQNKIKELADYDIKVKVFRQGNTSIYKIISSKDLVPGDLFALENNIKLPCDVLLISGEAIINESMLTGESTPIPKYAIEINPEEIFDFNRQKRHIIFEGTKVLQLKTMNKNKFIFALVIRTAYMSLKGQMIRTILFPQRKEDKFFIQAAKFMISYMILCLILYFGMLYLLIKYDIPLRLILLRFADTIISVIPPALNIYFQSPVNHSLLRLKKKGVLCLQPHKIRDAGFIRICCFDKTGTLTENGMDVYGFYEINLHLQMKLVLSNNVLLEETSTKLIFKLMATCHNVCLIDGELLGDVLEIKMLDFSQWKFIESSKDDTIFHVKSQKEILNVCKIFEFESEFQCMSTIVQDPNKKIWYSFTKGAPEKMLKICRKQTLPSDYSSIMESLAIQGFRILALAYKIIEVDEGLLKTMKRNFIEDDLVFLGFLILQNKMKKDTAEVMWQLRDADLALKIISGDNPLTTIQAAKESMIINERKNVIVLGMCEFENKIQIKEILSQTQNNLSEESPLRLYDANQSKTPARIHDKQKIKVEELEMKSLKDISEINLEENSKDFIKILNLFTDLNHLYEFAITGAFLEYITKTKSNSTKILIKEVLLKTKVFSRIKPDQKGQIIELLKSISGVGVAMVGDGANDCCALKKADIGISFTQADASFAAPFTSIDLSISCLVKVLLEGRACILSIVEIFIYTENVNFVLEFAKMILTFNISHLNDFQYIIIEFLMIIPFTISFGFSAPLEKLSHNLPDHNLFGYFNLIQNYGLMLISAISLSCSYILLIAQKFYIFRIYLTNDNFGDSNQENTVIYYCSTYLILSYVLVIISSHPFKKRVYTNIFLIIWFIANFGFLIIINFMFSCGIESLELLDFDFLFKFKGFLLNIGCIFLAYLFIYIVRRKKLMVEKLNYMN